MKKRTLMLAGLMGLGLGLGHTQIVRADGMESAKHERNESPEKQRKEEEHAHQRYLNAVKKHGENSKQAMKAKARWEKEQAEHGH